MRRLLIGTLSCFIALLLITACIKSTKEVSDINEFSENIGLETIPIYRKGLSAFDTKKALQLQSTEKKKKIEQLIITDYPNTNIPDPWIPPVPVKSEKLTKALRFFPKDKFGFPDWTGAVNKGILKPKSSLDDDFEAENEYLNDFREWIKYEKIEDIAVKERLSLIEDALANGPLDLNILFQINDRLMANVLFPHKIHSFWLSCKVCHPRIFKAKRGANDFTMYDIWNGEYCGRCHGKVAFQPKGYENCQRCHSSWKKTMGIR